MGHPTATLLLLLLLLLPAATSASCFSPASATQEDFSNSTTGCGELDWSIFGQQRRLLLAHNGIGSVSPTSRVEATLEELDLSHNALQRLPGTFLQRAQSLRRLLLGHNRLQELPDGFFASAAALQSLELQDNPLPAVPSSAFHPSLSLLTVPCRCDAVHSVLTACARAANLSCLCTAPDGTFNVSGFYERECPGGSEVVAAAVGATAAVVAVLVAVAVGVAVCRRRRKAAATAGWGKQESAVAHGQPRYISHGGESGPTATTATAATGVSVAPEYENVFISPCVGTGTAPAHGGTPGWQQAQYSPQVPADDTYFMESDAGEHPIYANTGPPNEEVYVVPDN
ncbi:leucine-rich repeat-containing protein 25-like [Aythya fuligula]|uniref:Leucine-rich repeat-containing protein 25-like n=1 Tax=Aythya fuligula TaxID=219594 RepID=A0A6J3E9H9_AYTFU|nr:leucine-rich repeat-containing protein 25-like [Aythya fuligula]